MLLSLCCAEQRLQKVFSDPVLLRQKVADIGPAATSARVSAAVLAVALLVEYLLTCC